MKRTIMMLATTFSMGACAIAPPTECEGPKSRHVTIHYGDSHLTVTPPIVKVRRTGEFVLKLSPRGPGAIPTGVDYKDVEVKVKGKPDDADNAWIMLKSGTWRNTPNKRFVYCVPENQADKVYEYEITVDEVGKLDPRVDVDP